MGKSRNHHEYDDEIEENVFVRKKKWYEEETDPSKRPRTASKFDDKKEFVTGIPSKMPLIYWDL